MGSIKSMLKMKKWYAIYTKSRNEKKVSGYLREKGVIEYLPLQKTLKQWSDRKKYVTEPLFKSYLFVHIDEKEYHNVLQTTGVVCFVTIGKERIPIPENQINAIKYYLQEETNFQNNACNDIAPGQEVEVQQGSMCGLRGIVTSANGMHKVKIKIEAINHCITLTIPKNLIKPVKTKKLSIIEP